VRVNTAAEAKQHLDIDYKAMSVATADRENAIINVLRYYDAKNAIVFGDTRIAVNRMTQRFNNRGFSVVALSGELSQAERSNALQALRDGRARVCVATDVAARGLDLPDLELVIHADVPRNREALLHRSGRTGRAGRKGVSALIVSPNRRRNAERLLRDADITAEWCDAPSATAIMEKDNERLLANMTLDTPVTQEEQTLVVRLLKAHSPEHIATAFIRQYRSGQSAPEDLLPANHKPGKPGHDDHQPRGRTSAPREDFSGGQWFSLNVGRQQKADPKWILPMLLKSGGLKKPDIGAIRIIDKETFVELAPNTVERFLKTIGPNMKIEGAITVSRIEGQPNLSQPTENRAPTDRNGGGKRTQKAAYDAPRKPRGDKTFGDKKKTSYTDTRSGSGTRDDDKPSRETAVQKKTSDSDEDRLGRKPRKITGGGIPGTERAKKPHKKKLARAAALKAKGGVKKGERKNTRKKKT
jgi:ATP-dependent RNA helicase DeaD